MQAFLHKSCHDKDNIIKSGRVQRFSALEVVSLNKSVKQER